MAKQLGTIVKRKYSATCLVKSYNNVFVGFIFCTIKQSHTNHFNAEFLPLSICIYSMYTFYRINKIQATMVIDMKQEMLQYVTNAPEGPL